MENKKEIDSSECPDCGGWYGLSCTCLNVNMENIKEVNYSYVAYELWNDIRFIEKRIREQLEYKWNLEHTRTVPEYRKKELDEAAKFQYKRFVKRRYELMNGQLAQMVERNSDKIEVQGSLP